jgi:hypothetical protein
MSFRDYMLAELKCAALRSRLITAETDGIEVALRAELINTDEAIAWLHDCGAMQFVAVREAEAEPA